VLLRSAALTRSGGRLLDDTELALLGKETRLLQAALLLGRLVLQARDNATPLIQHQIVGTETTRGLVRGLVHDLNAGAGQLGVFLSIDVEHVIFFGTSMAMRHSFYI